ncbi:MAG TPA: tRNA pseudouridine(54/55) synthase Pus10 [Candidatus Thermoplasmatota archaeon]|nr:tRNA pseudouridine(54/55) synthase Pus10 [Candidatus Thermoplasmatota archaeon]
MAAPVSEPAESLPLTRRALEEPLCDTCLGRLFGAPPKGATSAHRGKRLRDSVGGAQTDPALCPLCEGTCGEFDALTKLAADALEGYEFDTLLVGTTVDAVLARRESEYAAGLGLSSIHTLKQEVNREVGLRLEASLSKTVDFLDPDIAVHLDSRFNTVSLQVKSAYFRGRYRKLARGIPQTRWPCRSCRGRGCGRCQGTGKMYGESVEEFVARPLMEALGGKEHALHGAGREDVDARMLGRGRPFIVEVRAPKRRTLDLEAAEASINGAAAGRVEVSELAPCRKEAVAALKDADWQKTYRVLVALEKAIKDDPINRACAELTGCVIDQQTPARVSHRRADMVRKRKAVLVRLKSLADTTAELEVRGESGLYVKELIHGDEGRTKPSFSELLGVHCTVLELDVLEIHDNPEGENP